MLSASSHESFLTLKMKHALGAISLDASFALTQPWTVLFGPSGSGKTTILRTIAGFVTPHAGFVACGERVLVDRDARIFVPPHLRPVRSAAQTARLFPHKTTLWNVTYGLGWPAKSNDSVQLVDEVIGLFRLRDLVNRMPRELSGGERQRAAVARAVISAISFSRQVAALPDTALLLLDEPFAGMDNTLRDDLLIELRDWLAQRKTPVLSVTHQVGEAFQLGAEVIKIADGKVVQQGPVGEVLADERRRLLETLNRR